MSSEREPATKEPPVRTRILFAADSLINGDRQDDYGSVGDSFGKIAAKWSATLGHNVTAVQVALCMVDLKTVRAAHNPRHQDSWIDIAGYAALGAEIATSPGPSDEEDSW